MIFYNFFINYKKFTKSRFQKMNETIDSLIRKNDDDDDIPNLPPLKLERTYKAICVICKNLTHVKNQERKGGICEICFLKMKVNKIGTFYKRYRRRRRNDVN